jgi:RNA polymerase sigma-70 factor (ECF subfamily)
MLGPNFPQVLAAARSGAEWAWANIYRDLSPSVLGYLRARGAAEPQDLTGEVFLHVVRDLSRFEGDERAFRSWVFVIAHHRLLDDARHRQRRPVEPMAEVPEAAQTADAEEEALESLAADRVRRIIEQLSPDQRDVLLLRVLGGLTVTEVAAAIGKRPGAVKALQRRGLTAIERALANEGVTL